jgi:hypothetical protein
MYPIVLNAEEIFVLRTMLRIVITKDLLDSLKAFRDDLEARIRFNVSIDPVQVDGTFATRFLSLNESYRLLDQPLFDADIRSDNGKNTMIVNVNKVAFEAYSGLLQKTYNFPPGNDPLDARFKAAIPSLKAAMELAQEQQQANVTTNMPTAAGRN